MDKRQVFNTSYLNHASKHIIKYGEKGSLPIDQSMSKKFNIDPATGRPMSDVQRLVKMQNDVEMQRCFAQLDEYKSNFLPKDMSDDDALMFMCPRDKQLPSELLSYREGLTKYRLQQHEIAEQRKVADAKAKADEEFFAQLRKDIVNQSKVE